MLSRISIDVDSDNQPIIKIEYKHSDDVRDKLVKKFMESFGSFSCFATFFFHSPPQEQSNSVAHVRPLPIQEFKYHVDEMKRMHDAYVNAAQLTPENNNL